MHEPISFSRKPTSLISSFYSEFFTRMQWCWSLSVIKTEWVTWNITELNMHILLIVSFNFSNFVPIFISGHRKYNIFDLGFILYFVYNCIHLHKNNFVNLQIITFLFTDDEFLINDSNLEDIKMSYIYHCSCSSDFS